MALEHLFQGSALNAVDAKGRVSVPAFLRQVIERDYKVEGALRTEYRVVSYIQGGHDFYESDDDPDETE